MQTDGYNGGYYGERDEEYSDVLQVGISVRGELCLMMLCSQILNGLIVVSQIPLVLLFQVPVLRDVPDRKEAGTIANWHLVGAVCSGLWTTSSFLHARCLKLIVFRGRLVDVSSFDTFQRSNGTCFRWPVKNLLNSSID